jgi:hypothetical protein
MMNERTRRRPIGPVLLGTAAGVMVGLLIYALLVTEPSVAYVVTVVAAAAVTGWAALECLRCDWADRGGDGHPVRRFPPSPSGTPGGPGGGQGEPVDAPIRPAQVIGADLRTAPTFFRRPRLRDGRQPVTPLGGATRATPARDGDR